MSSVFLIVKAYTFDTIKLAITEVTTARSGKERMRIRESEKEGREGDNHKHRL